MFTEAVSLSASSSLRVFVWKVTLPGLPGCAWFCLADIGVWALRGVRALAMAHADDAEPTLQGGILTGQGWQILKQMNCRFQSG